MTIQGGDPISMGTRGVFEIASAATGSTPSTPTLAVSTSTTTLTATISDSDTGVTNYLLYLRASDTAWQDGGSRSGDGDITVADLSYDAVYAFLTYSVNTEGLTSLPSMAHLVTIAETYANDYDDGLADMSEGLIDEYGESVKYIFVGGSERTVNAIVTRRPYEGMDGIRSSNAPVFDVMILNDSTDGISSTEVDTGGDKIELGVRYGDAVTQRRVTQIIIQDAGALKLEVR